MLTCSKTYSDIPFGHRQSNHSGHCRFIHGHNWAITLTFSAEELDENGFVVDFGNLKYIKKWIDDNIDHACVLSFTDECFELFNKSPFFKVYGVEDCSCEGLAKFFFETFNQMVIDKECGRVKVLQLTLSEDSKNYTTYSIQ